MREKLTVRDFCHIGIFSAMIAVLSQISIPMPYGVPMTLQTFIVPLAGIILGAKKGTISTLVYVMLGMIGVPVFAGFVGGLGIVFGKTGGFILTFPLMALAAGIGAEKGGKGWTAAGLVSGAAINYLGGILMFSALTGNTLAVAFAACVLPFIPTAIIKIIMAGILGPKCRELLVKGKVLA